MINKSYNFQEELKPLRDKITDFIRDLIISGEVKPGEKLTEEGLSSKIGISRTPLREALLKLQSEGLVKVLPRKGAIVEDLSKEDANETYLIKGILEGLAGRLATEHITDEELGKLVEINHEMLRLSKNKRKDPKQILKLNSEFHKIIIKSSKSKKLIKFIDDLRKHTLRYNSIYLSLMDHIQDSIREHEKIIKALKKRDSELVELLIKKHNETARKYLYEKLK